MHLVVLYSLAVSTWGWLRDKAMRDKMSDYSF